MRLILTDSVKRLELTALKRIFPLEAVKAAAQKSLAGLGENIKNSVDIPNTVLRKVYLTSTGGAGRVVFLIQIATDTSVLVMMRLKNDKQVGVNMTVKNPQFKKVLEKNLDLILSDLEEGAFEALELLDSVQPIRENGAV